jgi:ParB family chromosome partitioning protein
MSDSAASEKVTQSVGRLGRGLGKLIPVARNTQPPAPETSAAPQATPQRLPLAKVIVPAAVAPPIANVSPGVGSGRSIDEIDISRISANPRQPRREFESSAIDELADSIRAAGLLQPVVIRPRSGSKDQFELIAGERRWRACKQLGWKKIPAIITNATDQSAGVWALIENVHRADLNPMERALSLKQLASEFRLTHEALAEQVGLDRSSVTNLLRLAELDEVTSGLVRKGLLSQGHAKALLGIPNLKTRGTLAESAVRGEWSVRALEREVQRLDEGSAGHVPRGTSTSRKRANIEALERKLSQALGTDVSIQTGRKPNTGKLQIAFYSIEQFEGIVSALGVKQNQINLET